MYVRASTGTSFGNAAQYDEQGLSKNQKIQKAGKVEFLGSHNLLADDANGIADEMASVASRSRSEKPVWNVSFSIEPGKTLTNEQWLQAVDIYLKEMGADPTRHQVAIWKHTDTKHEHVHALINAVPTERGPALLRYHNNRKAAKVSVEIDKTLGLTRPDQRTSLRSHSPKTQAAREMVATALKTVLTTRKPTNFDELTADLQRLGITAEINLDRKGISFKATDYEPVKGSSVGFKFAYLDTILEANRAEYLAEIERLQQEKANAEQKINELTRTPVTIEKVVDRVVPDPADQTRIVELEQQLARLRQQSQAEINQLKSELSDAYDKRDTFRDAFLNQVPVVKPDPVDRVKIDELEREKEQLRQDKVRAETDLNNLKNQPPAERLIDDPKNKQRITELEQQNKVLQQKLEAAAQVQQQFFSEHGVQINAAQASLLVEGKDLMVNEYKTTFRVVDGEIKVTGNFNQSLYQIRGIATTPEERFSLLKGDEVVLYNLLGSDGKSFNAVVKREDKGLQFKRIAHNQLIVVNPATTPKLTKPAVLAPVVQIEPQTAPKPDNPVESNTPKYEPEKQIQIAQKSLKTPESTEPTLVERFKKVHGIAISDKAADRLKAGEQLNFSSIGKTVWLDENGQLKSVPYQKKEAQPSKLDPVWADSMQARLMKTAGQSKNQQAFETKLKAQGVTNPPISVEKGPDGVAIYKDKDGSATAEQLGFKEADLKAKISPTNRV